MTEPTLGELAMQVAASIARKRFKGQPDRAEKVLDSMSRAWEDAQHAPPEATPGTVAYYAVLEIAAGRHFPQSSRSIDGPNPRKRKKPKSKGTGIRIDRLMDRSAIPGEVCPFWMDFAAYRQRLLTDQQRAVLNALASGDRTQEAADRLGLSPVRISQVRRVLESKWNAFQRL